MTNSPGRSRFSAIADTATTIVMVLCALAVTVVVVRREFGAQAVVSPSPKKVREWREYAVGNGRFGAKDGTVSLVVFSDFECPFCKRAAAIVDSVVARHPDDLSVVFRHYPLVAIHPSAFGAAVAAECAARSGQFKPLHDSLFARQAKLAQTNLLDLAVSSGAAGASGTFQKCVDGTEAAAIVRADSAAGSKLGVTGTPTLLVNQWMIVGAPSLQQLDSIVAVEVRRAGSRSSKSRTGT